jgi:predicted dehydrogenase
MSDDGLIRIGIVGCGDHSHVHAHAGKKIPGVVIASCCDIIEERAENWAKRYNCEAYYTDIGSMLSAGNLDAVILCTWPKQHLEQIQKCLSLGIKNILCEKSLALSGTEAQAIWDLVKKENAFLMEAFKYRHHPAIRKLEQILSYRDIGPIDSIRAVFSNYEPGDEYAPDSELDWRYKKECGGGVPYDWMSYLVNGCNHFSGGMPKRVFATGNVSEKHGVINRIHGMIEYSNGVVASIESSKYANFSEDLEINCAHGRLKLPIAWGIYGEVAITQQHRKEEWGYILNDTYQIEEADAFELQLRNFAAVIRGKEKPVMPLAQSVVNVCTIEALVTSVLEQRILTLEMDFPLK